MIELSNDKEYKELLERIVSDVEATQHRVVNGANSEMMEMFWRVGGYLNENNAYGTHYIDNLAYDLRIALPQAKWTNARNLRYMAKFARETDIAILHTAYAKLSWSHNKTLMDRLKDLEMRRWYACASIESGWVHAVLVHQIDSKLYERQRLAGKVSNFERTLPAPESELAQQQLKDPYIFDFITTHQDIAEREIEQAMVRNVTSMLLELGSGFAFLGNQYHLAVNDTDFYLDLLFYNTKLRSYVVVELKNEAFKPEFAGKLNFYLTAVDELMRGEYDNPTIGLLLCREKDDVIAEWSLRDIEKPMGVSEYRLADVLPDAEALQWRIAESLEGGRDE